MCSLFKAFFMRPLCELTLILYSLSDMVIQLSIDHLVLDFKEQFPSHYDS